MDSFGGIQSQVRTTMSNINTLDVVDENGVRGGRDEDEKRLNLNYMIIRGGLKFNVM